MANTIQIKRGNAANLPTLADGEPAWAHDTYQVFIGDGSANHEVVTADKWSSAYSVLTADTAKTPTALALGTNSVLGRLSGNVAGLTGANLWSILTGAAGVDVSMNGHKITSVGSPTASADAATKSYVDNIVSHGLTFHEAVLDKDTLSPPSSPSTGDRYWIGGTGSGDWSGHDYEIAQYNGSGWDYEAVTDGDTAFVTDENKFYYYDGDAGTLKLLATAMGPHASTHYAGGSDQIDVKYLADSTNILLGTDHVKDSHIDWGTGTGQVSTDDMPEGSTNKYATASSVSAAGAVMKSSFTAKGQIFVGTGSGAFTAFGVGSDGQVLQADSSQTAGVKWADSSQTFVGLTDTPSSYTANDLVRANSDGNALEFVAVTAYLDDTPANGATGKGATSNWAYNHNAAATGVHGAGSNTLLHSGSTIDGGTF